MSYFCKRDIDRTWWAKTINASAFAALHGKPWTAPPTGTRVPWIWELLGLPRPGGLEELPLQAVATIGLDVAKSV